MLSGLPSINPYLNKFASTLLVVFTSTCFSILMWVTFSPDTYHISVNEISNETIVTPKDITIHTTSDKEKTNQLKQERIKRITPVKLIDENISKDIQTDQTAIFTQIKTNTLPPDYLEVFSEAQLEYLNNEPPQTISSIEYYTNINTTALLQSGIETVEPDTIKNQLEKNLNILQLSPILKEIIYTIIIHTIRPNKSFNEAATNLEIETELSRIEPFNTSYKKGQIIVYKGEKITGDHIETLTALNMLGGKPNYKLALGLFIICLGGLLTIERFNLSLHKNYRPIKYLTMCFSSMSILIIIGFILSYAFKDLNNYVLLFLIPIPILSMLISFLSTPNLALLSGAIASLIIAIMFKLNFTLFIFLFFSNISTTFLLFGKNSRKDLINTGYKVGIIHTALITALFIIQGENDWITYAIALSIGFGNSIVSSMISIGILPYFESIFQITTQQTLMELAHLNHPLMKKLQLKAPGTYHHSLMVANLGENAAESIHADPILTRVGGYFHDIGKMKRPSFFSENQFSGENPHNTLSARMSYLIIRSHIKDGIELAETYRLPKVLHHLIQEHHGSSVIFFFLNKAKLESNNEINSKDDFRYPGPKPSSKESGILLLADSVEAAVRSMEKPTINKIEQLVNKIFEDKLSDNQLDECDLSLREISTIKQTFLSILNSMYHTRIDYKEELSKLKKNDEKQSD